MICKRINSNQIVIWSIKYQKMNKGKEDKRLFCTQPKDILFYCQSRGKQEGVQKAKKMLKTYLRFWNLSISTIFFLKKYSD